MIVCDQCRKPVYEHAADDGLVNIKMDEEFPTSDRRRQFYSKKCLVAFVNEEYGPKPEAKSG